MASVRTGLANGRVKWRGRTLAGLAGLSAGVGLGGETGAGFVALASEPGWLLQPTTSNNAITRFARMEPRDARALGAIPAAGKNFDTSGFQQCLLELFHSTNFHCNEKANLRVIEKVP